MLKKNAANYPSHDSTMGRVYKCVSHESKTRDEIVRETGLRHGQVKSALHNLVFIGLLAFDKEGTKSAKYFKREGNTTFPDCLKGVSSVFNHSALP